MNSREAFEKWAERIGCSVSRMRTRRDIYVEYDTTALWDCWQAATERAAVICDEVRHPHGECCETVDWVNGTFYCAITLREENE